MEQESVMKRRDTRAVSDQTLKQRVVENGIGWMFQHKKHSFQRDMARISEVKTNCFPSSLT